MVQEPDPQGDRTIQFGTYEGEAPKYKGVMTRSLYLPMRDGIRLAVDVVLPKDLPPGSKIPTLLSQTRYWRDMELRAPFKWFLTPELLNPDFRDFKPFLTSRGYAIVLVDVRGTGASFGTCPHPWAQASIEDAREVLDWIMAQPWSNGVVGTYGISYLGTTAELAVVLNHPAVKAAMPMFNHPDAYSDIAFPGGIFNERFIKMWGHFDDLLDRNVVPQEFGFAGRLLVQGVKPVAAERQREVLQAAVLDHAANGNAYALARVGEFRDVRPQGGGPCFDDIAIHRFKAEMADSRATMCGWASWMDAGTADAAIRRFLTYDSVGMTVIGAWDHGGIRNASPYRRPDAPPSPTLAGQWREMLRFFDACLKDVDNGVRAEKALFYYTMGEEKWKKTQFWPPEGTKAERWYLAEDRTLLPDKPRAESGADHYTVDPEASTGDCNRWWEMGALNNKTVIYGDRARADERLLTYTSPPLAEDTEITGYPVVTLYVASTEADGAFYVYLEDVDEKGRVTYVTEGLLRALHRKVSTEDAPYRLQVPYHSFKQADAMPLVPGEVAELTFGLLPTSVLVKRGHRLRIALAGHDNGTFVRIPAAGTPVLTVERNALHASCIDLPVVQRR